jgi:pimeloyl-ACP methyl ester carboxylesterase
MLHERLIEVRGAKLNLRRAGAGEPVLFLHGPQGFAGCGPAVELLSGHFDVLAPDHPGFGLSDAPDEIDDVPDLAFFYLDMLTALGLRGVHIVGHSLGGWIALEMAVRSTERIKSLVLAGAAGIRIKGVPRTDMFMCSQDELTRLLFVGDGGPQWQAEQLATPDAQEIFDRNRFAAAKLCWQPRLFDPKLEKWLHRIDRPTQILWGEDDKIIPPAYARRLQQAIAGASLALIPGAGHMFHVETPEVFAGAVQRFIAVQSS